MLRLLCVLFMLEIFALDFSHARRQYLNEREVYQEPFPELSHNAEYHRSHQLPPLDNDRRVLENGIFALDFSHARRQYLNEREVYQEPFPELSHNAEYHRSHQLPPLDNDRRVLENGVPSQPRPSSVQQREINDLTLKLVNRGPVNPIELEKTLPKRKPPLVTTNCTYGLCEDVPDYPTERILALLKKNVALKQYFSDVLPVPDIGNRGTFGDGETLCDTKTHTKFPKLAKNIDNVEKTIVNVDKHQQGIVFETCGTEDGACRFSEAFPDGYVSSCKQKYVQRRMMVMSNSNENLVFDNFEFPSCCICILKKS